MIELTTGVVFLMSSLYGSGQSDNHVDNITDGKNEVNQVQIIDGIVGSGMDNRFITDPRIMESYLRREYSDTPLLVDIARCESNFKHFDEDGNVIRGIAVKEDIGVMQINETYHGETSKKLGMDIHTIEGNIAYAKYLYEREGSKPWKASAKCWSAGNQVAKK